MTTEHHVAALRTMARFAAAIQKAEIEKILGFNMPDAAKAERILALPPPLSEADYIEIVSSIAKNGATA